MANQWDERFSADGYYYGTEPNDFLREQCGVFKSGGDILSLGEGEGRNAVFLATRGFAVTGMDGSGVGLEKMARLARERGVSVTPVVSDLVDFDIGHERWDGIVSIWCHLPKPLRRDVFARCRQALKPGGSILIEAYTARQLAFKTGGPPCAELMMSLAELREELTGLEEIVGHEIERDVREGKGHTGRSAVVQYIARRR